MIDQEKLDLLLSLLEEVEHNTQKYEIQPQGDDAPTQSGRTDPRSHFNQDRTSVYPDLLAMNLTHGQLLFQERSRITQPFAHGLLAPGQSVREFQGAAGRDSISED